MIAVVLATARGLPAAVPEPEPAAGRVRSAIAYIREQRSIRTLFGVQIAGVLFFTVSIPAEVVFAEHTLQTGAGGYGALLSVVGRRGGRRKRRSMPAGASGRPGS